jgi:hypothetical protein
VELCLRSYPVQMRLLKERFLPSLAASVLMLAVNIGAAAPVSQQEANRLQLKIEAIVKNSSSDPPKRLDTAITESEANSYLAFNMKEAIPAGLTRPEISMVGNGTLAGSVTVDLDQVKRQRGSGGLTDLLSYLSGQVPVHARGILRTRDGTGQFQLTAADINGIPLPKAILQELVTFFSRTAQNPAGFNIDAPFNLPAKIREVAVRTGEGIISQ